MENKSRCQRCAGKDFRCYGLEGRICGQCCRDGQQCSFNRECPSILRLLVIVANVGSVAKRIKRPAVDAPAAVVVAKAKGKAVAKATKVAVEPTPLPPAVAGPSKLPPATPLPPARSQPPRDAKRPHDLVDDSSPEVSPVLAPKRLRLDVIGPGALKSLKESMVEGAGRLDSLARNWIIANNAVMQVQREMLEVQAWYREMNEILEKFL